MTVCFQRGSSKPDTYEMNQTIKLVDWHIQRRAAECTHHTLYL